jgi:hypothetical protein
MWLFSKVAQRKAPALSTRQHPALLVNGKLCQELGPCLGIGYPGRRLWQGQHAQLPQFFLLLRDHHRHVAPWRVSRSCAFRNRLASRTSQLQTSLALRGCGPVLCCPAKARLRHAQTVQHIAPWALHLVSRSRARSVALQFGNGHSGALFLRWQNTRVPSPSWSMTLHRSGGVATTPPSALPVPPVACPA